jgi:putative selenium metabolism protein SsnA
VPPANFGEILQKVWWRLDRALTKDDVYHSALIGLIESAKSGVGTVIDHHSSPNYCENSLDDVALAYAMLGMRGSTCFEVSDRNGEQAARQGIRENIRFAERLRPGGLLGPAFGLHASFTLSDGTLRECMEVNQSLHAPFHVHVAEDSRDRDAARRLCEVGILNEKSLAAHCVYVSDAERRMLGDRGVNVVHNPQSNCSNGVGAADIGALVDAGAQVGLGTDGYSPRIWDDFKTAGHVRKLLAKDPRAGNGEAHTMLFRNNREIVRRLWGWDVGRIAEGALADLIVVDYRPPTPIAEDNLMGHVQFGISNASVDSTMVNGSWVIRHGRCVRINEEEEMNSAAACAKALWTRI